jgi:hypothetical protein
MTKNITLSANEKLIAAARKRAISEHTSLNVVFREWLFRYAHRSKADQKYDLVMNTLRYADAGRHFDRNELNER